MKYRLKVKQPTADGKGTWVQIGYAADQEHGPGVSCTIYTIPVGWDGRFAMFPADWKEESPPNASPG